MKRIFIILAILVITNSTFSQHNVMKDRKVIYLVDVTLSMWGKAPKSTNIFNVVQKELIQSVVATNNSSTEIIIVTFQDKILETWTAQADPKGKKYLVNKLKSIKESNYQPTRTNILCAWKKGRELVDSDKTNIIYLLTDGIQNTISPTLSDLYKEVSDWGDFSQDKDYYAFLVELVANAQDQELRQTINNTNNAQVISGINFFVLSTKEKTHVVNLDDHLAFNLNFIGDKIDAIPQNFTFDIKYSDNYFSVNQTQLKLCNKPFTINLNLKETVSNIKNNTPTEFIIDLPITYDNDKFQNVKFLNNTVLLKINNKKEKVLRISFIE